MVSIEVSEGFGIITIARANGGGIVSTEAERRRAIQQLPPRSWRAGWRSEGTLASTCRPLARPAGAGHACHDRRGCSAVPSPPSVPTTSAVDPLSKDDHDARRVHDRSTNPHVAGWQAAVPESSTPRVRPAAARCARESSPYPAGSCSGGVVNPAVNPPSGCRRRTNSRRSRCG